MDREKFLVSLLSMDAVLTKHGVPALSQRWKEGLARFLRRGVRRLVIRAGRRSGKSLTLCKIAVAMALYADIRVPTGDIAWAIFVSTTVKEAQARLHTIATFLDKLGVPYDRSGDEIRLKDGAPLGFQVLAANYKTGVGRTAFMLVGDEMSRWEADGLNPSEEVWSAFTPMTATIEAAIEIASSSPLSTLDLHYKLCEMGDTDFQSVLQGPTWQFNPTVSEAKCRELAGSDRIFNREYRAIPTGAISAAFDIDDVAAAFRDPPAHTAQGLCMVVDPSSGGRDGYAYGFASWCYPPSVSEFLTEKKYLGQRHGWITEYKRDAEGKPIPNPAYEKEYAPPFLRFSGLGQFKEARKRGISGARIVAELAGKCKAAGVHVVHSDQREQFLLESEFAKFGIKLLAHPYTNPNKVQSVERVQSWLRDRMLVLPPAEPQSEELRKQMLQFDQRITPSGAVTFAGRGTTPDDLVSLLITAAIGDSEQTLAMSPYTPRLRADDWRIKQIMEHVPAGGQFGGGNVA